MNVEKLYYIENFLIFLILVFGFLNIFKFKNNYLTSFYSNTKSFLIILVSYYLICRLPTIFGYDFLIGNPDETHYITNANKVKFFEFNFDNIDHGTSGIINSIILGWPILFFQDSTLFTTRFTNSLIIFLSLFICYKIFLNHNINKKYSLIFLSPIVLYFTGREYHSGYTSGVVPVFFCIFAYLTFTKLYFGKHISNLCLFFTGFFLGLIPFTKLQGIPLGFLIGFLILIEIVKQKKIKSLFLLILSTITPGLLILMPLIYKNNFDIFYVNYILNNLARADIFFEPTIENILLYFRSSYLNQFSLIIFIISVLGILFNKKIPHKIIFYHTLIVITAIYTVIAPRYMADHHMHFVSFFVYILAIVIFSEILNLNKLKNFYKLFFILLLLAMSFKVERWSNYPLIKNEKIYNFRYIDMLKNGDLFNFDSSQKKSDTIFVWGWDSINYLNSGLKSATKRPWFEHEILNQFLKIFTSLKGNYKPDRTNYFINDTLEDLNKQKPKIFINANVSGRVGYDTLGFKEIYLPPEIKLFFQNYKLLNKNVTCPKIFMEKIYYEKFIKKYIQPTSIFVSSFEKKYDSSKLDDFEVDRKCDSFWMGLHGKEKTAEFNFEETKVNKINILSNFHDNYHDKATSKNIIINLFYQDKLIEKKKIILKNYPKWTLVDLDGSKISKIIIELPRKITGLAEVKLLK